MSDAAPAPSAVKKTSRKKSAKPAAPRQHPPYGVMIKKAIAALKERKGSSRQALLKYIRANFKIGAKENADLYMRMALRAGTKSGKLVHTKGVGASGSFRLPEKKVGEKKVKKPKAKKPKKKKTTKKVVNADGTVSPAKPKKKVVKKAKSPKKKATPKKPRAAPKTPKPKTKRPAAKKVGGSSKKAKKSTAKK